MQGRDLREQLTVFLARREREFVEFRRDLHRHPELAFAEHRTTQRVADRLRGFGLDPALLPQGTGLTCDIGSGDGPVVALRADIDALPLADEKDVDYRSTVPGIAHACGHDAHTAILLATGLFLAQQDKAGVLPGRVRLIFQPAEELPGGAREVIDAGRLDGVDRIFALHCDPRLPIGQVGLRSGPITAACDRLMVRLSGPGGHTARPHLTADLVYALGKVVTELPAALSRRVDPRAGLSLAWGRISAGTAPNAIPDDGVAEGTVRCLDDAAWHAAPELIRELLDTVVGAYGARAELSYVRGVPPTVNEVTSVQVLRDACSGVLGPDAIASTPQSLGGEDFAWYLERVPGALARLGTYNPESGTPPLDLHRGTFDIDERAIGIGVQLMAATALTALWDVRRAGSGDPRQDPALA
ncbi:amidohydrolase [Murinocardiopsis flavida]|uniref:Amidohydrolase n=1 Tax=Murinocardiopsis flavida TaxID=645275 RepID=A0A2P8DIJ6_9ACTN|nr:M20 family metallopeptidase [Murinocardiopsis flavida]PSK97018.1 amidohydrolase [Murinocardiopsis flavida]